MSDSEVNDDLLQLSAKELERRRRKNKKKKMSKKLNRANNANAEAEEAIVTEYMEKQAAEAASDAAAKKAAFDSEAVTVENDAPVEDKGTEESAIDCSTVEQKDVVAEKSASSEADAAAESVAVDDDVFVEIDYVSETPELDKNDPNYAYFSKVFNAFKIKTEDEIKKEATTKYIKEDVVEDSFNKAAISEQILQEEINQRRKEAEEAGEAQKLSRRKLRLSMQPSIADLKESTPRPDVVEWADVTSRDPYLLVELKAYRNTVMVPRHWNAKRKYLAGKRGFERPPFELPDFIKRTGIMEMRETMWEKEDSQSLKSKMRERTRPKMGRIDIDYQKLHDAFFKWQTKPPMTRMGELYYEGKELEAQMKEKKPGQLSDELRIALGMPVGPTAGKFPPPWLIAMQRYGPPPSYPNLKIPGLNAPIPEGCSFGYHAGGWGKPPVDEYGKPLYGDVFGIEAPHTNEIEDESRIERRHWGEIGSDEEDSDEESDVEEDEGPAVQPPESGFVTPATTEGFATPSGITTIPGVETPDSIELRKRKTESVAGGDTPQALYRVLEEKRVDRLGGQIMGSSHVYDLSQSKLVVPNDGVEVSLNPEELDMTDQRGLERKYEEQLRKQNRVRIDNQEDLSDMVAEQNAKLNRKRRATDQKKNAPQSGGGGTNSSQKKYKDFKF